MLVAQSVPGRHEIIAGTVQQHRCGNHQVEVAENVKKRFLCAGVEPQVFGKAQQHDVAERKTRQANFIQQAAVDGGAGFTLGIAQVYFRRITDARQQRCKLAQIGLFLVKMNDH